MKRIAITLVVLTALAASLALAQTQITENLNLGVVNKFWVGAKTYRGTAGNAITRVLGASATVDFASTSVGRVESSGITVTGASVGDACSVGTTATAGALIAQYTCYVSAADTVKVVVAPLSEQSGSATLNGASPSVATATVTASSVCTCAPVGATAAIAAGGCAVGVASTTLTMTSANGLTNDVNYRCVAPVDPASGTFYVRVVSAQ